MPAKKRERCNPYCAFTDDSERRRALVSRDIRLVAIALGPPAVSLVAHLLLWRWL
jgi:hypothetical protein